MAQVPTKRTGLRVIVIMCACHFLTMIGFSLFPALLLNFTKIWGLSGFEAGAISAALFAGYTIAVPILVSVTDRICARNLYCALAILGGIANLCFASFASGFVSALCLTFVYGVSLAGTYMPGLKVASEFLDAKTMARATGFYTGCFSLGAAISFLIANGMEQNFGWQSAFYLAGGCGVVAGIVPFLSVPSCKPKGTAKSWAETFNFRSALQNRDAVTYSLLYGFHSYELMTVRTWIVAYLVIVGGAGSLELSNWFVPGTIAALVTMMGLAGSLSGSEVAIKFGARLTVRVAMIGAALVSLIVAGVGPISYIICVLLVLGHGVFIMLDSAVLTASAVACARDGQKGITMAVHSTLGFAGAIVGPVIFGLFVDGIPGPIGMQIAYAHLAIIGIIGVFILYLRKPKGLRQVGIPD